MVTPSGPPPAQSPPPGPPPPPVPGVPDAAPNFAARRLAVILAGALVVLGVGLYAAAYAAAGSNIKKGTSVLGIDIGGLSRSEAESRLAAELPAVISKQITITADQVRLKGPLKELGLYTVNIHLGHDIEGELKVWVVPTVTEEAPEKPEKPEKK